MSTKAVRALVSIDKSNLKDDIADIVTSNGFTMKEYESMQRQLKYRQEYNRRPEVQAARKQYRQQRYLRMKQLKELLG